MIRGNPHDVQGGQADASATMRRFVSAQLLWGYQVAHELGLTPSEFAALNIVSLEASVTPGRLSRLTGLTPAAVTRLVDRLVERGFVARAVDPNDRRRVSLTATHRWQQRIDAAVEPHRAAMRVVLAAFSVEERRAVFGYLEQAGAALAGLVDD